MIWTGDIAEKPVIYLTFDDGPIPEITPWVLDLLKQYNCKATFFCVGENAARYPEILHRIREEGHSVGNHTYNHLNGWKTADRQYIANVRKAEEVLHTRLFRPPYGRITPRQHSKLPSDLRIVMWSILTKDYDKHITPQECLDNALQAKNGDIVLFHDSAKARENLYYALPRFLETMSAGGYEFKKIL